MLTKFLRAAAGQASSAPTDPDFSSVSLLLHGNGTNGAQNNTFIDSSTNNFTITRNGNTTQGTFNPFVSSPPYSPSVNGGSGYFDGTGDYLSVPTSVGVIGTNDITIEAWVYVSSLLTQSIFVTATGSGTTAILLGLVSDGTVRFRCGVSGNNLLSASLYLLNSWNHIAVTRTSGLLNIFINGVKDANSYTSSPFNFSANDYASVGATNLFPSPAGFFNGYISNLRMVDGTVVYTANFTPPTAPLTAITNTSLLLSGTNAGIFDNAIKNNLETVGNAQVSTTVKQFGTGSISFDGTGDWLTAPNNTNLQLSTGNFTIEAWVYLNAVGSVRGFVSKGTSTTGWSLGSNSLNQVVFSYDSLSIVSTGVLLISTWYFVTVVREGTGTNQTKIYINGTNDGTGTVASNFNQTNIMYVGANRVAADPLNGYIDDLRITKGVARYTANFTAPTAAFPNS
jgi:hypothetical protein